MGCRLLLLPFAIVVLGPFTSLGILRAEASEGAELNPRSVNLPFRSVESRQSEEGKELHADASQDPVECNAETSDEAQPKSVTIDEKTLQAKFRCTNSFDAAVIPDCQSSTTKCCKDATCTSPTSEVEILDHLGVKGKAKKDGDTVTVTLEKVPDKKRGQKIFYKCKKQDGKTCLVAVALPGELKDNECAIDRTISIPVSTPQKSVNFKCGGTLTATPFQVNDEKTCENVQSQATTALQLDESQKGQEIYKLSINELPDATTKLCYKCTYRAVPTVDDTPAAATERLCSVMVTISGKVPDGTNKTSTSPTSTESSASSVACRILIFVTLTFGLVAIN